MLLCYVFFFKQKTAYGLRISDWSSDVCSSDLRGVEAPAGGGTFRAIPIPASVASALRRPPCRKSGFSTRHQAIRSQAGGQGGRSGRRAPGQAAEAGRRQPGAERVEVRSEETRMNSRN